jgi:hypothetical protein
VKPSSDSVWKFLVEGELGRPYYQVIVARGASASDALATVRMYLEESGSSFVGVDEEETQCVDVYQISPELRRGGDDSRGIVGASGRIWVMPELAELKE